MRRWTLRTQHAAHLMLAALAFLVPVLVVGLSTSSASAAVQDFEFESMRSEFYLGRDGGGNATLRTVETLVAVFPDVNQNHGIERSIPLNYGDARLDVNVLSVTDANGTRVPYSRSDDGEFAVLRIGSAESYVHGTTTYRLEYTQRNVVRSFDDTKSDEFYWDVNGTGWGQPFRSVSATVHLQKDIASSLTGDIACYQGYEGSTARCEISTVGDTVTARATGLLAGQNMTIAIGFDQATFVDPPILKEHWFFAVLPWVLLGLTGAALLFVIVMRIFVWRDARGRGIIIPQYSPPKEVYPMLAAELLQRPQAALPAQIVRFAVARVLAIREHPGEREDKRYELELLTGWPTAPDSEEWVLKVLFAQRSVGRKVLLDPSDRGIGDRMANQKYRMAHEVTARGWRARPVTAIPGILKWTTFAIAVAALVVRFVSIGFSVDPPGIAVAAVWCIVGWIVVSFASGIPELITPAGAEVRDYIYGMRDYISLAEADRIRVLQAPGTAERIDVHDESAVIKLYEKLLPYAMIFGIERE